MLAERGSGTLARVGDRQPVDSQHPSRDDVPSPDPVRVVRVVRVRGCPPAVTAMDKPISSGPRLCTVRLTGRSGAATSLRAKGPVGRRERPAARHRWNGAGWSAWSSDRARHSRRPHRTRRWDHGRSCVLAVPDCPACEVAEGLTRTDPTARAGLEAEWSRRVLQHDASAQHPVPMLNGSSPSGQRCVNGDYPCKAAESRFGAVPLPHGVSSPQLVGWVIGLAGPAWLRRVNAFPGVVPLAAAIRCGRSRSTSVSGAGPAAVAVPRAERLSPS